MSKTKQKSKKGPAYKRKNRNVKIKKGNSKKVLKSMVVKKFKADYGKMSVDDFMNQDFGKDSGSCQKNNVDALDASKKVVSQEKHAIPSNPTKDNETSVDKPLWGEDEDLDGGNSDSYETEITSHKASLDKLKKIDPEFYKFLQENDKKLLEFNISDSEHEDDDDTAGDDQLHKPTGDLEVASDESDFEGDGEKESDGRQRTITLKMLKNWQTTIRTDRSNKTIRCVVEAFHAALLRVSNEENEVSAYKVDGSSIFNAVIQLCVLELSPAIRKFLRLTSSKMQAHKSKRFVKVKTLLRSYFTDLLKLLGGVTSANILTVLLKHLHQMSPLLASFPKLSKPLLKKLIHLWGTGEEVVRILAFLCILRITNNQLLSVLDTVLKSMYMTYIINSKFVSVSSLSAINFMRRSLVEIFALDTSIAYQHVFLYIRQLAIHLRNAIIVHKKENVQTVYNWQFVNSLKLWGNLLAATHGKPQLQPLVYPFVQVCLGTLKLVATAQYYPLRFHIVQILVDFSRDTGVFIPVLPFILEVLHDYDFNKKHKKVSMKPLNLTCVLRASNSQMSENGYKNALIESIYALLLEYLTSQSSSIAFPDLTLFCTLQIKQFTKKCTVANYNKKLKQILDKVAQNSEFIEKERKNVTFKLTEYEKINAWETTVRNKGTPMDVFYQQWNKMRTIKKKKEVTANEEIGDYNLPVLKKVKKATDKQEDNKPFDPFPSDGDESDDQIGFGDKTERKPKSTRRQKREQNRKNKQENNGFTVVTDADDDDDDNAVKDIVEDLNISDW